MNGNLVVNSGTLSAAGQNVTVTGGLTVNSAGVFTAGNNVSVSGSISGAGVVNGQGAAVTVGGSFTPATYSASTATTTVAGPWGPGSVHSQQRHRDLDGRDLYGCGVELL